MSTVYVTHKDKRKSQFQVKVAMIENFAKENKLSASPKEKIILEHEKKMNNGTLLDDEKTTPLMTCPCLSK